MAAVARHLRPCVRPIAIGAALFATALAIRTIGIDWHGVHPDEDPGAAARVLAGQLTATTQYYPPLFNYLVAAAYIPLYAVGRLLGWWHSAGAFRDAYFSDRLPFTIVARLVAATASAAAAPLAYLLARELRLADRWAVAAGVVLLLLPGSIYWAHIAKSDNGLAAAFLLTLLAASRLLDAPERRGRQALLGVAVALAVSFKHSAVFFVLPLLGILAVAMFRRFPLEVALRSGVGSALVAIVAWVPMNVGILLDPAGFIAAQQVQSQMSSRPDSLAVTARAWAGAMTSLEGGVPAIVLPLWAIVPALAFGWSADRRAGFRLLAAMAATVVATVTICHIAGGRQPTHLWLPYGCILAATVALAAAAIASDRGTTQVGIGAAVLALLIVLSLLRLVPILSQFLSPPMGAEVAAAIRRAAPPGSRVLDNVDVAAWLPLSPVGERETRARHERLAAKYHVTLPAAAATPGGDPAGYVVRGFPFVIGGLESVAPETITTVLPFAWPLQPEEWSLDYWLARGYSVYVVEPAKMIDNPVAMYRRLGREIAGRCVLKQRIAPRRPLLGEAAADVYVCALPARKAA